MKIRQFIEQLQKLDPDAEIIAPTLDAVNHIGANDYAAPYAVDADNPSDDNYHMATIRTKTVLIL